MTSDGQGVEAIIEPDLPIIDPHHHLHLKPERYLLDEILVDLTSGHNVRATVFAESHTMYRTTGPESMKSLGEVEFANGVGAMAASGEFGDVLVCAGIEGYADLQLGAAVEEVLEAHIQAAGGRYRAVRVTTAFDPDPALPRWAPGVLLDKQFRAGFRVLGKLGLSFGATVFEPQLADVVDLARSFPETPIVLTHCGFPLGIESYAGKREERYPIWRTNISALAQCDNVTVKLGGLGMKFGGFDVYQATPPASSEQLAAAWKPYMHGCIEAFGADRCMFESNYPEDAGSATYPVLWNAFKRLAADASAPEKTALFFDTAARVYRLDIPSAS